MNSCILMAEIVEDPQLRYTSDNLEITEMLVRFPGTRPDDPPATLKVVGWGNMAKEIQQNFHEGDRVLIEGRLGMNTIERREGFKEKRAELTVQRIHALTGDFHSSPPPSTESTSRRQSEAPQETSAPSNRDYTPAYQEDSQQREISPVSSPKPVPTPAPATNNYNSLPDDDIPAPKPQKNYQSNPYPAAKPDELDEDDIPF